MHTHIMHQKHREWVSNGTLKAAPPVNGIRDLLTSSWVVCGRSWQKTRRHTHARVSPG